MRAFRSGVGVLILSICVAIPAPAWAEVGAEGQGSSSEPTAARARSSSLFDAPVAPMGLVRFQTTTTVPGAVRRLKEDRHTMTFEDETGQAVTVVKAGHKLEGEIIGIEDGLLTVSVSGKGTVQIRERDVVGLELRQPGSNAKGVLGVLVGVPAGLIVSGLVCATARGCNQGVLWAGVLGGATLGAAAGAPEWQRVPVVRSNRVALSIQPVSRGAGVGVSFGF